MSNKGFSLIELLIVIVVMSIVTAFAIISVSEIIDNSRQSSFVATGTTMVESGRLAYVQNDNLWDDDIATLQELLDAGYISIGLSDPWGGTYNFSESYVVIESITTFNNDNNENQLYLSTNYNLLSFSSQKIIYRIKLVSTSATLGYDAELENFTKEDILFLDGSSGGSLYDSIIESFNDSLGEDLTTDNGDDEINVDDDIKNDAAIVTLGGNDTVNVGDDIKGNSSVDLGEGDDILNMDGEVRDSATVNTGSGNDTVTINDDIQDDAVVTTGDGNDTVNVGDDLQNGALLDTGSGDDTVTVGDELDDATLNTGSGNDTVNIDTIRDNSTLLTEDGNDVLYIRDVSSSFDGSVSMGAGDDVLTIIDKNGYSKDLKSTDGTFDGGSGNDTLNLPHITLAQWNSYVSDLFSGFETVVLQDTTINP